jgi:heme exporter protein C
MARGATTPLIAGPRAAADRRNLGWLSAGLGTAGLLVAFTAAPPDAVQGDAQRVMYLHVPAAWTAYLAFAAVLVASLANLIWRDPRWDRAARAAAEIGVGLTALTIALGSIWGRATWGVWWTWEPRVVTTTFLLLIYCGYLAARCAGDGRRTGVPTTVAGVAGFGMVPVVHFSVVWWRSLHQQATVLAPDADPPIDLRMATALLLCVGAFTATAGWLFLRRLTILERGAEPTAPAPQAPSSPALVKGDAR